MTSSISKPPDDGSDTTVTVVVPCRNVGSTLAEQLKALERQDYPGDFEVIVVNHGSTDDTVSVAAEFTLRHRTWSIVEAPVRPGINVARNAGVAAANGMYVALCDGDDIADPGWLTGLTSALSSADIAGGQVRYERMSQKELGLNRPIAQGQLPEIYGEQFAYGGCMAFRKAVWDDLGGFDESFRLGGYDEADFAFRARRHGYRLTFAPAAQLWYRQRNGVRALIRQRRGQGRGAAQLWVKYHGRTEWRRFGEVAGVTARAVVRLPSAADRKSALVSLISYLSFELGRLEGSVMFGLGSLLGRNREWER